MLMTCYYPDLRSASDWLKEILHEGRPVKSYTQVWVGHVISMEFFCWFLRCHFARKTMASRNVGFFF